jgi:arsenate reductase-like glutaredoxin family protein
MGNKRVPDKKASLKAKALAATPTIRCTPPTIMSTNSSSNGSKNRQKVALQTLLPGYIWVVPNFFTKEECQDWIQYMDKSSPDLLQQRGTRMMAARECYRVQLNDNQVAEQVMQRLQITCPSALNLLLPEECHGCNPNIRMYKYTKGMSFGKHIDDNNVITPGKLETRMTVLVYLSNCQGGATRFDKPDGSGEVAYEPVAGNMLIHLHGKDCLLHAGDAVLSGEKYILRTDLVYVI